MKKVSKNLSLFLMPILLSCGGSGEGDNENTDSHENGDSTELTTENESMYSDIEGLTSQTSFTTDEFIRLVGFLEGEEVTITGYPYAYPSSTGNEVEFKPNSTRMLCDVDNSLSASDISIRFLDETETQTMISGDLFAVKGIISVDFRADEKWGNSTTISLRNAVFVDSPEDTKGTLSSVSDIDLSKQIFSGDLFSILDNHNNAVFDKGNIQIVGDYYSTTISKNTDGEIIESRVDLGSSGAIVGCELIDEPVDEELAAEREADRKITIEGTFSGAGNRARITNGVIK